MKDPKISVCAKRQGFQIGCFDGIDLVRDFIFYIDEQQGMEDAEKFFKGLGIEEPKVIRPVITKMVLRS